MRFLPESGLGRIATLLTVISAAFIALTYLIFERMDALLTDGTYLGAPIMVIAIVALFLGLAAVVRDEDRSVTVLVSVLFGVLVLLVIAGNLIFH
ncbi:hypothetical protein [Youngiibacter multivorans]|uniref:Uncharacterized protein n=1 Tax=Youngiibacter multivorans TaxID=937251 RepID=A0ABS4G1H2_9CLOT|nr:hypothetical protein [Youngiibacter multivorans]MBP1918389.1 hypothetical protein [Youngiibacter multivorans]